MHTCIYIEIYRPTEIKSYLQNAKKPKILRSIIKYTNMTTETKWKHNKYINIYILVHVKPHISLNILLQNHTKAEH